VEKTIVAYIGLDWADERHSVHLQAVNGRVEHVVLEQKPAILHEWIAELRQRFGGGHIAVALEQRKGAVIHALLMYDCFVLYPINPKALARYREAFSTSGAKDDPLDSALLLDLVVRHREQLRAWVPDTVASRTLEALCEQRRKLVNHRAALTNRLASLLKQYFPQALEWVGDLPSAQACDFLAQWPTLAAVQRARPKTIRQFYRAHNCRKAAVIEARLAAIASARALTTDAAVIEPLSLSVHAYATQLRAVIAAIQTFDARIAAVFAAHADHDLFTSFPALATSVRRGWPRLLAATGHDGTPPQSCRRTRALRPSRSAVARPYGSITGWRVPSS
jgi:hypothetical protein